MTLGLRQPNPSPIRPTVDRFTTRFVKVGVKHGDDLVTYLNRVGNPHVIAIDTGNRLGYSRLPYPTRAVQKDGSPGNDRSAKLDEGHRANNQVAECFLHLPGFTSPTSDSLGPHLARVVVQRDGGRSRIMAES